MDKEKRKEYYQKNIIINEQSKLIDIQIYANAYSELLTNIILIDDLIEISDNNMLGGLFYKILFDKIKTNKKYSVLVQNYDDYLLEIAFDCNLSLNLEITCRAAEIILKKDFKNYNFVEDKNSYSNKVNNIIQGLVNVYNNVLKNSN